MAGSLTFPGIDLSPTALKLRAEVEALYALMKQTRHILSGRPGRISLSERMRLIDELHRATATAKQIEERITPKGKNEHKIKPPTKHSPSRPRTDYA